mgnify:CR=1 FL=1
MRLHDIKPRPNSRHATKRLGCGESSGHGKTSGKGHKGQRARAGGTIRSGFEGGQMPLIRRLPKRGFNNARFRKSFAIVNVGDLERFENGATVGERELVAAGLIRAGSDGLRVLARGELSRKLEIVADHFSEAARVKIEKAGGTVSLRESGAADASA